MQVQPALTQEQVLAPNSSVAHSHRCYHLPPPQKRCPGDALPSLGAAGPSGGAVRGGKATITITLAGARLASQSVLTAGVSRRELQLAESEKVEGEGRELMPAAGAKYGLSYLAVNV